MVKISLKNKLEGLNTVPSQIVAESNNRINIVMKEAVRDFQKKQKTSIEKASRIVLNA